MSNPDFRGDGSNLSIEETNKIRLQLGLKPLEIPDNKGSDQNSSEPPKIDNFVHVPAKNIGDIKNQEKYENELRMQDEARKRNELLSKEKHLGSEPVESTMDFVKKVTQKKIDDDAKKAKMLQNGDSDDNNEMDITDERPFYGSKDLSGISIEHKASRFQLAGPTVLTLKDKNILDEENDDVLVNVNIVDEEAAEKNIKNKKMGIYGAYIDSGDEDDPLSLLKPPTILAKYDEEIDGPKRNRFILDSKGRYNMGQERAEDEMRKEFFSGKSQVMFNDETRIASDYYTESEMRTFKSKRRKARGVRTNKPVPVKMETVEKEPLKPKKEEGELAEEEVGRKKSSKLEKVAKIAEMDFSSDEDYYRPVLILPEIQSTSVNEDLKRKIELMKKSQSKVLGEKQLVQDDLKAEATASKIVLTTTEEYTKSIFNCLQSKRKADAEVATQVKEEPVVKPAPVIPKKEEVKEEEPVQSSGWQPEEKILSLPPQPAKKKRNFRETPVVPQAKKKLKLTDGILGDEVQINAGIYSTLILAKNKGYLDENKAAPMISNPKNQMLRAQHFQEEKIRYDDIDQKCPRRERRNLPETSFQDKSNFTPDIKLDYHDDFGRPQPAKEAFRSLSHRFHGKTSGKIKSEKRSKKMQEQSKISSSIGETEMKSVSKMHSKMKSENRYCVPLSGKNSIIPAAIKKSEKK